MGAFRPVRAVLFDYAHTLVDFRRTEEALHDAYEQVRQRIDAVAYMEVPELLDLIERVARGVDRMIDESYRAGRLQEVDQATMLVEALASIGFDLPRDVMDHVVALDHSAYSNSLQTDPDVMATLAALQGAGYRMGIVSNMTLMWNLMREDLERVGMLGFFDATVFSSEVGVRKPDPRIFREALGRIGAEPTETVFVGDRLYDDVTGAQGVGMRAVQTRQFSREVDPTISPDAAIERLSELPAVLQTWGGPPIA